MSCICGILEVRNTGMYWGFLMRRAKRRIVHWQVCAVTESKTVTLLTSIHYCSTSFPIIINAFVFVFVFNPGHRPTLEISFLASIATLASVLHVKVVPLFLSRKYREPRNTRRFMIQEVPYIFRVQTRVFSIKR